MTINEMVEQAHANARNKGFWEDWDLIGRVEDIQDVLGIEREVHDIDTNNAIATRLALIHSEISEALEALRIGDMENFAEELADIVIRVADMAGGLDIDLEQEIIKKMEENKVRGYMHGKRF